MIAEELVTAVMNFRSVVKLSVSMVFTAEVPFFHQEANSLHLNHACSGAANYLNTRLTSLLLNYMG